MTSHEKQRGTTMYWAFKMNMMASVSSEGGLSVVNLPIENVYIGLSSHDLLLF